MWAKRVEVALLGFWLGACGGGESTTGPRSFTVGGTVSGLAGTLVLQNNGADDLTLAADGPFTFAGETVAYSVTVMSQPPGQTCTVANATGSATRDVTDVAVTCVTHTYDIGGDVAGLDGTLVLQNNGGDDLVITASGPFTFATPTAAYDVSVLSQPPTQTCTVTGGAGTAMADVTAIAVSCVTNTFTIGGSVSGLDGELVLQNDGADNLTVTANGPFAFATPASDYDVTVLSAPADQVCEVTNGNGTATADVTTVAIHCEAESYVIGGEVTGLDGTVVLQNNGGDTLPVSADGPFTFPTEALDYHVTVLSQPVGQTCAVIAGFGHASADVTTVEVVCADNPPNTFTIGGTLTGVVGTVVLRNNGGDDLALSVDGPFNFPVPTVDYDVTLHERPAELLCELSNAQGTATANVDDIEVTCTPRRFFRANDGTNGLELWVTDGTNAGTFMLKDIHPGAGFSTPVGFASLGAYTYFAAADNLSGRELWRTDGTGEGTQLFADINPGAGLSSPAFFMVFGDALYFYADDGTHGSELWKTDGTPEGTVMVKDIHPSGSSYPFLHAVFAGELYFSANDGTNGVELWKTDGTESGTVLVKDINTTAAGASSSPESLMPFAGALYFSADDGLNGTELWKTDGTAGGTVLVKDLNTTAPGADGYPYELAVLGDALYFGATDGVNGWELWTSDGTAEGTVLFADLNTTAAGASSSPGQFVVHGGALYFPADNGTDGVELWRSDGTETVMVEDIHPGVGAGSNPSKLAVLGDVLTFMATDGVDGYEIWRTDGTAGGTQQIADICSGSCSGIDP